MSDPIHGPNPLQIVTPDPGEPIPHHYNVLYLPHQRPVIESDTVPVGKIAGKYWCKYCYRTHTRWWMMNQDDYRVENLLIILCGYCESTTGIAPDGDQTWYALGAFDEDEDPKADVC